VIVGLASLVTSLFPMFRRKREDLSKKIGEGS
jgi:hypothetical protein